MIIILPKEKPKSWNQYLTKTHWTNRKQIADEIHKLMFATLANMGYRVMNKKTMFTKPVNIIFTAYFNSHMIDPDNLADKPYIDGLKFILLNDDSPAYVNSVLTQSRKDKHNPRVEIEINEVD